MQILIPTEQEIKQIQELKQEIFSGDYIEIKPYSFYKKISWRVIRSFLHQEAIYCLPTKELIEFLDKQIGELAAIEIGCGNGSMAKALGLPATDSKMQERADVKLAYTATGQPLITYPKNIESFEAIDAVKHYKPEVVFGSYITKKFDGTDGNYWGVHEPDILKLVNKYIHIGDEKTHATKPLMRLPYQKYKPEWLIVRGTKPFIGIWTNNRK